MCGIIGFYNKKAPTREQLGFLTVGLFADTVRGNNGTGVAGICGTDPLGNNKISKLALAGPDFLRTSVYEDFVEDFYRFNIFIGHNRAATRGEAKEKNTHPFYVKGGKSEIILVHNGTLNDYQRLSPSTFNHDVDSAHVAAGFAHTGERETLEQIDGWFVLVWANLTERTFNIARSDCRDIAVFTSQDKESIYFGSEAHMLDWIMHKHGLQVENGFRVPKPFEWFSWSLDDQSFKHITKKQFNKFVHKPYVAPQDKFFQGARNRGIKRDNQFEHENNTRQFETDTDTLKELGYSRREVVKFSAEKWVPFKDYSTNKMGIVWGETYEQQVNKPVIKVKAYSVWQDEWDLMNNALLDFVQGKAVRVEKEADGTKVLVVSVDSVDLRAEIAVAKNIRARNDVAAAAGTTLPSPEEVGKAIVNVQRIVNKTLSLPIKTDRSPSKPLPLLPDLKLPGPNGEMISQDEWRVFTQDGCAECGGNIKDENHKDIAWTGEYLNQPLCHEHSANYHAAHNRHLLASVARN